MLSDECERMVATLYDESEWGILEQFNGLAAVSEYTNRYYIYLCVVCVYITSCV